MQHKDHAPSLGHRAAGDLSLIRSLMQRTALIVPMSGWALVAIGSIGLVTAGTSARLGLAGNPWVTAWLLAALLATVLALLSSNVRSRKTGHSILTGSHSRFWLNLLPGFLAAAALTLLLMQAGLHRHLPGLWLMLYGVSVLAAGTQCIVQISWMGAVFLLLGAAALFLPWPDLSMAAGFGGTHMVFGLLIARQAHA